MSGLKVWKGIEMEGPDKGIMTLFIKSTRPTKHLIQKFLTENKDCNRVYLGAGRLDIECNPEDIVEYCKQHFIELVIETTIEGLCYLSHIVLESSKVIIRIQDSRLNRVTSKQLIKIDTENDVYISKLSKMHRTNLETLSDDLFSDIDQILYEEEV